ncbi:preprotein translocase subunit SecG [Patescibacteria group bacterium]|nr:preprotein translocase subunit SecG [Patescibacteria group bacterium]MBU1931625.1 preprotein translocase subunit SecG [Patescibacteria group bacterium]
MQLLTVGQIIVALLLISTILLQSEGSGLSSVLGGSQFYGTRRGVEKVVFGSTVALAIIFILLSLIAYLN